MTQAENNTSAEQIIQRTALLKLAVLLGATILVVLFYLFVGYQQDIPAIVIVAGLLAGFAVVAMVALYLAKQGRVRTAMWLTFIGMMVVWPVSVLIISGFGVVLGLSLPILVILLADNILSQREITQATILAVVVGILTLLLDLFGPVTRAEVPTALQAFLPIVVVLIVVIYGIFIARNFKNYSLRTKLITATAVVAIVAIVSVTTIVGITTRNALTEQLGTNLHGLAETQALAVGELMTRQVNLLESLALNKAIRDSIEARTSQYDQRSPQVIGDALIELDEQWRAANDTERLVLLVLNNSTSNEMRSFRQSFPDHTNLILADEYGGLVAATERPEKYDYSQETWWQDAMGSGFGSVYLSRPYENSELGTVLVDIAVPVRVSVGNERTKIGGVLLTSFRLNPLANILLGAEDEAVNEIDIHFADNLELEFNDVGAAGTRSGVTLLELKTLDEEESDLFNQLSTSGALFLEALSHGEAGLNTLAFVNTRSNEPGVDRLGWSVHLVQAAEVALAPVREQQQANIILGIVIVVVASITAAVVAQFLAGPITRLTDTAVRVAGGDLSARAPVESNDEIGVLASSFNQMTTQLQESIVGLEERVAERTRALEASTEVSRSLSTILNPDQLVIEVVEQVRVAFDYYYVQIYLFDETHQNLQLAGGTGEAGQVMLARGHKLAAGQGLVGRAASTRMPVFIPDVSQARDWKSNPLLPDTKAEIAVPIAIGEQVLGVLDVQHDVTDSLVDGDVQILQSVAYQVAIAIQNARSFDEAKKRGEREAKINAINQKIQNATSIDAVLQIATAELGQMLGGQKTTVQLHNPSQGGNGHGRSFDNYQS